MRNKYYTPDISEFHDGFSYEITSGYEWVKKEFSHEDFNSFLYQNLVNAIKQNYVRVRHLDKEDIESVLNELKEKTGKKWKYGRQSVDGYNPRNPNQEYILEPYISIVINPNIQHILIEKDFGNNRGLAVIFNGIIKNKSELKKLLMQLEIL